MTKKSFWVVLPASGIGSRMKQSVPKQYLPFLNNTVIETTLNRLLSFESIAGAVVVLNKNDDYWSSLEYTHAKPVILAEGGSERFESVYSGVQKLQQFSKDTDVWVMIHDAVRPCVTHEDLQKLVDASNDSPMGLFLSQPVADTLKQADENLNCVATVDRSHLWRAFTPQVFPLQLILKALHHIIESKIEVTDDVSAVESLGLSPKIVVGRSDNIKITYPQDLAVAEVLIENQKNKKILV